MTQSTIAATAADGTRNEAPAGARPSQPTLIMMRGLPGAGKTTRARQLVDQAAPGTVVRVGVDDLATMLYGTRRPAGIAKVIWASVIAQCAAMFRAAHYERSVRPDVVTNLAGRR